MTLSSLPPEDADRRALVSFAESFDGYTWGDPEGLGVKLGTFFKDNPGKTLRSLVADGTFSPQEAVTWSRGILFLLARRAYWDGSEEVWVDFERQAAKCVRFIRRTLEGDPA
jgi:hypothetical protein